MMNVDEGLFVRGLPGDVSLGEVGKEVVNTGNGVDSVLRFMNDGQEDEIFARAEEMIRDSHIYMEAFIESQEFKGDLLFLIIDLYMDFTLRCSRFRSEESIEMLSTFWSDVTYLQNLLQPGGAPLEGIYPTMDFIEKYNKYISSDFLTLKVYQ